MYFEIIDKLIAKCLKKLVDWQDNQRIKDRSEERRVGKEV